MLKFHFLSSTWFVRDGDAGGAAGGDTGAELPAARARRFSPPRVALRTAARAAHKTMALRGTQPCPSSNTR